MMKALFIDDDNVNNQIMEMILKDLGYTEYEIVSSANEAVSILKSTDKKKIFPSYIFLDLNMPGMNGYEFLELFKKRYATKYPECKVVIVSSAPAHLERDRISRYTFIASYVEKPILDNEIIRHLQD